MNHRYTLLAVMMATLVPAIFALLTAGCAKQNPFLEPPDQPVIDSVYPAAGMVGTQLRLYGTGFSISPSQDTLSINGVLLRVDSPAISTVLLATLISYTGTGRLHIKVNGQQADGPIFTMDTSVVAGQDPSLTSINPSSGWTDTVVTIRGLHFGNDPDPIFVSFGSQPATIQQRSDTLLVMAAPAPFGGMPGVVQVSVLVHNKTSNSLSFTYTLPVSAGHVVVSTFAGDGGAGYVDGPGASAEFSHPDGVATDASGNVYVADFNNSYIRKITSAGVVSTLAGNGVSGYSDGTGPAAQFESPVGLATDAQGNIYVADFGDNRIRKVTPAGVVSTLAGDGNFGYKDGNGPAAEFSSPTGVAVDLQGNVYVADYYSHRIRKITPAGVVSTLAGSGVAGFTDGPGSSAQFFGPTGVVTDPLGNVYVSDYGNYAVRKITPAGVVSTLATVGSCQGIAIDQPGNIYTTDASNYLIKMVTPSGVVSTLAGNGLGGFADGPGPTAEFGGVIYGLATDAPGNIYVGDAANNRIRKIIIQ